MAMITTSCLSWLYKPSNTSAKWSGNILKTVPSTTFDNFLTYFVTVSELTGSHLTCLITYSISQTRKGWKQWTMNDNHPWSMIATLFHKNGIVLVELVVLLLNAWIDEQLISPRPEARNSTRCISGTWFTKLGYPLPLTLRTLPHWHFHEDLFTSSWVKKSSRTRFPGSLLLFVAMIGVKGEHVMWDWDCRDCRLETQSLK